MIQKLVLLLIIILGCYYIYDQNLFDIKGLIKDWQKEVYIPEKSSYKKDITVNYVKNTNDFSPDNKQGLLNIYYTALNSGWDELTFYCPDSYKQCIDDVRVLSLDKDQTLSHLNSFVEPYNEYNNINTKYYENGKVTINIKKVYDNATITAIKNRVNKLYNDIVKNDNTIEENIRSIHDYLINHTIYDIKKISNINDITYHSNTAYGLLYEGYAVCSGYADTMSIFLDKMNIPNIRVATNNHVWNLAYINNEWLHLDLTWDDPVTESGRQILSHAFFLINAAEIENQDKLHNTTEHDFDKDIYVEAK